MALDDDNRDRFMSLVRDAYNRLGRVLDYENDHIDDHLDEIRQTLYDALGNVQEAEKWAREGD